MKKPAKKRNSGMEIMTAKTTTRTFYVHVVLNGVIIRQISYDIVPCARNFLLVRFFPSITLINNTHEKITRF